MSPWLVPLGFCAATAIYLVIRFRWAWDAISDRLARDLPQLLDSNPHLDTPEDPCRWSNYANYRICLPHGIRDDDYKATS